MRIALAAVLAFSALTGCASVQGQRAYMDAAASHLPEGQALWARPQEVGYSIGNEISGEATNISILLACSPSAPRMAMSSQASPVSSVA